MEEDPSELSCLTLVTLYDKLKNHQTELLKYQSLYQRIDVKDNHNGTEGKKMILDKSLLYPLLIEYDKTISSFVMENLALKNTCKEFKHQLEDLITENESLNRRFKEILQIKSTDLASVQEPVALNSISDDFVLNLQHQLNIAVQEKELAERKWRYSMQEFSRLENSLQGQNQFQLSSSELTAEIERLRTELQNRERKLETTCCRVKDLQETVEDFKQQIYIMEKERTEVLLRKKDTDELSANLEFKNTDQEIMKNSENKEMDLIQEELRHAINMVENAILLKDQAKMQCNQKDEELEKMQEVFDKLINDAGVKTRQEVDSVRKQSNNQIRRLTEELNRLEMENIERQAESDRQLREKKALESELDKVYKECMMQSNEEKGSLHTLNQRAINAEEEKNKLKMKLESLQTELQQEKINCEEICAKVNIQLEQLQDCNVTLESRIEKLHSNCLKYQDEISNLRKSMQVLLQEKETLQRKFQKEVSTIEHDNIMKIRTYEAKITTTDEANRHAISELHKILTSQQRMTSRWKEENHAVTKKFEAKMQDLRNSMDLKEKQNEEIKFLLIESRDRTQEALNTLLDANRSIRRMEKKVKESEEIASDKTKKLAEEIMKSRKLENEKQTLTKEILKLKKDLISYT